MDSDQAADRRVAELVAGYAGRIRGAVWSQHEQQSVCSPLGIWLLLCAATVGAEGEQRESLERAVGCAAQEAGELLDRVTADGPAALAAALALWTRGEVSSDAYARWIRRLPDGVEIGLMPAQEEADAWARRGTLELIRSFPVPVAELEVCLASAVATRVSWREPFGVADARERFPAGSPWRDEVGQILRAERPRDAAIVQTSCAGVVAVFEAEAQEELTVVCVSADPDVPRDRVLDAAQEVTGHIRARTDVPGRSLFDLPVGDGHSWSLVERECPARHPGERFERITEAYLPAWTISSSLDLLASEAFAADTATDMLMSTTGRIGPKSAQQSAVATFDRFGFHAAALTVMAIATSKRFDPLDTGVERIAELRFDHPFAAIAVSGRPSSDSSSKWVGVPLFEAWVTSPTEPEAERDRPLDTPWGRRLDIARNRPSIPNSGQEPTTR